MLNNKFISVFIFCSIIGYVCANQDFYIWKNCDEMSVSLELIHDDLYEDRLDIYTRLSNSLKESKFTRAWKGDTRIISEDWVDRIHNYISKIVGLKKKITLQNIIILKKIDKCNFSMLPFILNFQLSNLKMLKSELDLLMKRAEFDNKSMENIVKLGTSLGKLIPVFGSMVEGGIGVISGLKTFYDLYKAGSGEGVLYLKHVLAEEVDWILTDHQIYMDRLLYILNNDVVKSCFRICRSENYLVDEIKISDKLFDLTQEEFCHNTNKNKKIVRQAIDTDSLLEINTAKTWMDVLNCDITSDLDYKKFKIIKEAHAMCNSGDVINCNLLLGKSNKQLTTMIVKKINEDLIGKYKALTWVNLKFKIHRCLGITEISSLKLIHENLSLE